MKIQIDDIVRDATPDEIARIEQIQKEAQELANKLKQSNNESAS